MSIALMTAAFRTHLPTVQKFVFVALCDNANDQGECYPSVPSLMGKCSLGERSVQNALSGLEAGGFIRREFRTGRSTVYWISKPESWGEKQKNPRTTCTPARRAPPHQMHPTPARRAPITINEPSLEPSGNQEHGAHDAPRQPRGRRIPDDWSLTDTRNQMAEAAGLSASAAPREAARFVDYWRAAPGAKGVKADWDATWRNWCRRAAESPSAGRGKPSRHDLSGMDYSRGVSADGSF